MGEDRHLDTDSDMETTTEALEADSAGDLGARDTAMITAMDTMVETVKKAADLVMVSDMESTAASAVASEEGSDMDLVAERAAKKEDSVMGLTADLMGDLTEDLTTLERAVKKEDSVMGLTADPMEDLKDSVAKEKKSSDMDPKADLTVDLMVAMDSERVERAEKDDSAIDTDPEALPTAAPMMDPKTNHMVHSKGATKTESSVKDTAPTVHTMDMDQMDLPMAVPVMAMDPKVAPTTVLNPSVSTPMQKSTDSPSERRARAVRETQRLQTSLAKTRRAKKTANSSSRN